MELQHKPLHVLLVEDSQDDADLILLELSEAGFVVVFKRVETEAAMREAMMGSRWNIVISDFNLPRFSAREALVVLYETDMDVPFIIVSGCIGEEAAIALMKEGASDFVMKHQLGRLAPVIERELRDAVARRERHQAQDALSKNEKLLRGITSSLGEGILVLNDECQLVFMNPEARRLLGWTESELSGHNVCKIIHSQETGDTDSPKSDFWALGVLKDGGVFRSDDDVFWCKDGSPIPVSLVVSAIMENDKTVASVIAFQDISQRKQAERELRESHEQLRELSVHQQSVREEERTRIARELHDELGQMLTGVKLDAMWLAARMPPEHTGMMNKIASMSQLIDETLDAMRRVAADLRPVMLDDLGLAAAIEWLTEEFCKRTGIRIQLELELEPEEKINAEVATAIFRIVQECLTNVARHAQAQHVLISLDCHNDKLMLLLSDNGNGIAATSENKRHSYGVIGMRERAHGLGGTLHLLSIPGEGTTVVAIVPLNPIGFAGVPR